LSRDAVKAILDVPNQHTTSGQRDVTFMMMLYGTAARINEFLELKISALFLDAPKPYATIVRKGNVIRKLYLLPQAVAYLRNYLRVFHGESPNPDNYLFFSRNKGKNGKLSQPAIAKMLKKHAATANKICSDVPLDLHAHQFRHAKASHWLEDGMNIVQISFLLGHAHIETTIVYLDITTEEETKAMATLEDENDAKITKNWKPAAEI
jgi:site-specific recombinase XerD